MLASFLRITALLALCVFAFEATAQSVPDWARSSSGNVERAAEAPSGGEGPSCPTFSCEEPPPVPIDGGLSLLALAGGAYAVRRLRNKGEEGDEGQE